MALDDVGPLEALETLRLKKPAAAVIVLTAAGNEADGAVALHAGADDHLVRGSIADGLLPRAVRYAVERRRMRRELATIDESTRLPNLRGFVAIAEHQLRMADRAGTLWSSSSCGSTSARGPRRRRPTSTSEPSRPPTC